MLPAPLQPPSWTPALIIGVAATDVPLFILIFIFDYEKQPSIFLKVTFLLSIPEFYVHLSFKNPPMQAG